MTSTEVNTSSAWAERTLAVLLLPFAFLVMVGGGAGLIWLWQDYRPQFWIGVCAVAVLAFLASTGTSVAGRQQRRIRWLYGRDDPPPGPHDSGVTGLREDSHALLLELLNRVDALQGDLDVIMGEFGAEQERSRAGRHSGEAGERRSRTTDSGPVLVDIRDDLDDLGFHDHLEAGSETRDYETDFDDDDRPEVLDEDAQAAFDEDGDEDLGHLEITEVDAPDDVSELDGAPVAGPAAVDQEHDGHDETDDDARFEADETEDDAGFEAGARFEEDAGFEDEAGLEDNAGFEDEAGFEDDAEFEDAEATPERRLRRLVRDRGTRAQWDSIPAPRDPVTSIDLTSGNSSARSFPPGNHDPFPGTLGSSFGSGIRSSLESLTTSSPGDAGAEVDEDDDERDYFGDDVAAADPYTEFRRDRADRDGFRDEYRSSFLGEDDDEHRREAR